MRAVLQEQTVRTVLPPSPATAGAFARATTAKAAGNPCACTTHRTAGGECSDCSKKKWQNLQAKLEIGNPEDIHEQEADQIADRVAAMQADPTANGTPPRIQRFRSQRTTGATAATDS